MKSYQLRYRSIEKFKEFISKNGIDPNRNTLLVIYAPYSKQKSVKELLPKLRSIFKNATIVGTSSDGEIINSKIITGNIILSIIQFEKSTFSSKFIPYEKESNFHEIGKNIHQTLVNSDTKAILLFSTIGSIDGNSLVKSIKNADNSLPIAGIVGGDSKKVQNGFVIYNENLFDNALVALSIESKVLIAKSYMLHGWEAISKKFVVTEAKGNRLKSLDGRDAKEIYAEYLGIEPNREEIVSKSLEFPFIKFSTSGKMVTTTIWDIASDGSLLLSSNLKNGDRVEISFANLKRIKEELREAFETLSKSPVEMMLAFASSARRRFLGEISQEEILTLSRIAPAFGVYGFGQFFASQSYATFLNQSIVILTLSEDKALPKIESKPSYKQEENLYFETIQTLCNIAQVSSKELESFNKKLEFKINESIREIRKKESIMIHNSRLAQLGEMLGLIAHQWRQPLSAISATATGMELKLELGTIDEEQMNTSLKNIQEYVNHLSETIDDFTNFFKPTKKRERVLVKDMIKKALFISSPLLTKEEVDVIKKYNSTNKISTYPNEVVQVLLNLIRNSVNVFKQRKIKEREISIVEYQEGKHNIIDLEDSAGGIDENILPKIFDPYFSTKADENSMGVGLYMSKFIIEESCGGKIEVTNGKYGAKFKISLPS